MKHDGPPTRSSAAIAIESAVDKATNAGRGGRRGTEPASVALLVAALACSAALGYTLGADGMAGTDLGIARAASAAPPTAESGLDALARAERAAGTSGPGTSIERLRLRRGGATVEGPVERRGPPPGTARAAPSAEALVPVVGRLQAEIVRLRVLFRRLAAVAELDDGEFDLELEPHELPAVRRLLESGGATTDARRGGSAEPAAAAARPVRGDATGGGPTLGPAPTDALAALDLSIRALAPISRQSARMARIFDARRGAHDRRVEGRVAPGTVRTSGFGHRANPFGGGRRELHRGVDYAGRPGTPIHALADGIVTWSGANGGYGNLVELEHADGFRTRYAHNMSNLVALGERVEKGQAIALLGSSGRSSGPHVHVEVREHGAPLDPARFVR